jgi:hypothetical protein
VSALEFFGQRFELSFGLKRGVGPVGLPHPLADSGGSACPLTVIRPCNSA